MLHNPALELPLSYERLRHISPAFWFMCAVLTGLVILAYTTIHYDNPFRIMSYSAALFVDEGFYSDAAQNFAKFGHWNYPFDFPHWAAAPMVTLFQSLVFPLFGPSLETARMLSVFMSLVSAFVFYSLLRMSMRPLPSMLLTVSGVLTFNFVAFSRTAFTDPTSTCLALLALLSYARVPNKALSIPLSVGLAFLAFLSKLYFLFTVAAIFALWIIDLIVVPKINKTKIQLRLLVILGVSMAIVCGLYMFFLSRFGDHVNEYIAINARLIPYFSLDYVWGKSLAALKDLAYDTKAYAYIWTILYSVPVCIVLLFWPRQRAVLISKVTSLSRAEFAVCLWLVIGLLAVGLGAAIRPHYHFFAILPLALAAAIALKFVFPKRLQTAAILVLAIAHVSLQYPYYRQWADRSSKTAVYNASHTIVNLIHKSSANENMIPVIGEYASQLGLFSTRIFPLDARWHPRYSLCARLQHWKPRFHVNVVWPKSLSQAERGWIEHCRIVKGTTQIARFRVFRTKELALSRIDYLE